MSERIDGWAQVFELGTATWVIFFVIGGVAVQAIRSHASPLLLLLSLPLVVLMSVVVNHAFRMFELFRAEKMGEWLAFTILAGTIGTLIGIAITIVIDRYIDRATVPAEPSK
jgi:hypothetical protein